MSEFDAKERRLHTIETLRQEAAGLLAEASHDTMKAHVHRAVRHLDEAVTWLNNASVGETARLQLADSEISAATILLAHVTKALATGAKEIG